LWNTTSGGSWASSSSPAALVDGGLQQVAGNFSLMTISAVMCS
jgi:hypothetical protein